MQLFSYSSTLFYLLAADFKIFKRTIADKLIDLFIWIVTMVWVTAYLMPYFGLTQAYSSFMIASLVASAGLFEVYPAVTNLIGDLEGSNITDYYLTLPIPSWMVFLRSIIFYFFNTAVLSFFVLPLSKIILWNMFDLSHFNVGSFLAIFIAFNAFYATFTLWIASRVKGMENIGSVWMRFVYPLWFLGGFQYSWSILFAFSPLLAYLSCLNPMIYVMEGTRASILGQPESLNVWLCVTALIFFTLLTGWHGMQRIKKRLDFC